MKTFLKQVSLLGAITATFSMNTFADNTPAQLDTTPPPQEVALATDQTPPIDISGGSTTPATTSGDSIGAGGGSIGTAPSTK